MLVHTEFVANVTQHEDIIFNVLTQEYGSTLESFNQGGSDKTFEQIL